MQPSHWGKRAATFVLWLSEPELYVPIMPFPKPTVNRFYEQARGLEKAGQSPSGNMVSAWAQIPVLWGPA